MGMAAEELEDTSTMGKKKLIRVMRAAGGDLVLSLV